MVIAQHPATALDLFMKRIECNRINTSIKELEEGLMPSK